MADSKAEIIRATSAAFKKHSYSELSVQDIADEFDKSKSLLYHHYNGKDEILLDFLDHMLEKFQEEILHSSEKQGPREKLEEKSLIAFNICQDSKFLKTLVELRTQALRDERYGRKFQKFEELYTEKLEGMIREGKEKCEFREEIDAESVAEFILAINNEVMRLNAADEDLKVIQQELENYLSSRVYRK